MQNLIFHNYVDSLVQSGLAERIQSQRLNDLEVTEREFTRYAKPKLGTYWLGGRWSSTYLLSKSKVCELVNFVVAGRA